MAMTPEVMQKFAEVYNDTAVYPTSSDVAVALGFSYQTVRNYAVMIRRLGASDDTVPALIKRTGTAAKAAKAVGTEHREIVTEIPESFEPVEDLINRACIATERYAAYHEAKGLVEIKIRIDGPYGVVGLPDHHLNNLGTQLRRAFDDAYTISRHPALFCVGIGDWLDNFIVGRLERERRKDIMSHDDAWRMLEHYVTVLAPKMIAAISGNHMDWTTQAGGVDVTKKMFAELGLGPIYDTDEIRVKLTSPNGASFVHKARHKYRGSSKYNAVHGILVNMLEGWQGEDIFWGGHIHTAGHLSIQKRWMGESKTIQGIQLGAYKTIDGYARQEGFRENVPFLVPMVVHDPARNKSIFFEDMHDGIRHLDLLRAGK